MCFPPEMGPARGSFLWVSLERDQVGVCVSQVCPRAIAVRETGKRPGAAQHSEKYAAEKSGEKGRRNGPGSGSGCCKICLGC